MGWGPLEEPWQQWLLVVLIVLALFVMNAPIGLLASLIVIVGAIATYMDLI